MMRKKSVAWAAFVLAAVIGGGMVMSANSTVNKIEARPIVRVAIGMNPAEVVKGSSYPVDFSIRGPFGDAAFQYDSVIVTANVDLEVLAPHQLLIEDVQYWDVSVDFDEVESFSADVPRLTLDEALNRAKRWIDEVEMAGWVRGEMLYSMPKRERFADITELREAFLLSGERKIVGATIGVWRSSDGKQEVLIGLEHKREDGGPRRLGTPESKEPANEKTYLLSFAVMYGNEVREYRGKHRMELRQEALKRKGLRDEDSI